MNEFLSKINGVIHVGAHIGQEKDEYKNLKVVWIEANPEVYEQLKENISKYPKQIALSALVTDKDDEQREFHIANCTGTPSSLFEFGVHKELWPEIHHEKTIILTTITLTTLLQRNGINPNDYQALVLDTQASELLVLIGSIPILDCFQFVRLEVADCESYIGGCQLKDISPFMEQHGFKEIDRFNHSNNTDTIRHYDITYISHT